jgi:hypothetical protein
MPRAIRRKEQREMSDERERIEDDVERNSDVSEDDFEGHQLGGDVGRFEERFEEGVVDRNEEGPGRNEE